MGSNKMLALRCKCEKRRWVQLILFSLTLLNVEVKSNQAMDGKNQRSTSRNWLSEDKGKRNVLYNYVTDRPRVALNGYHGTLAGPRGNIETLQAQKQHLAKLIKYRQYLTKLYNSKRRSDIGLPILQGDMADYKDKQYQNSPELLSESQLKDYEGVDDVNKKYGRQMVGLNYYTKDVLPENHVVLPTQDYHSVVQDNLDSAALGYSQYPSSTDEAELEKLVELEKLQELEELRGIHLASLYFRFALRYLIKALINC